MKLATLNTHSLVEEDYEEKLIAFVEKAAKEKYDVIALQEVNQTHGGAKIDIEKPEYMVNKEMGEITSDNHMWRIVSMLQERGVPYYWAWTPIKLGYGKYDEGIGILSRKKPEEMKSFYISAAHQYEDWHSRKVIGVKIGACWYYSVHMGWWKEEGDCFADQWKNFLDNLIENDKIYVMGDFNNPAHVRKEGYDLVIESGFYDTWHLAGQKDEGITVCKTIDGWYDKGTSEKMRIDYIFQNTEEKVASSQVIFNGDKDPVISDHFGVQVEI